MSVPVREPDGGPLDDGPSSYAPKKLRHPEREPIGRHRDGDAAAHDTMQKAERPPWKRSKHRSPFVGDVAITELRNQLALAPDRLPEPPPSMGVTYGLAARLAGVAVVTAVGVIAFQLGSAQSISPPWLALRSSESPPQRSPPAAHPPQSADRPLASRAAMIPSNEQKSPGAASSYALSGRLNVEAVRTLEADQAARLIVSAADAGPEASVVMSGLVPGSTLSTGAQVGPNTWRLSIEELTAAAITPPRGFVGGVDLALELRLADNTVADRKSLRLEWSGKSALAPAKSQQRRLAAGEIALFVKTGTAYMANGNIGAARMMFQPGAEAGDAVAAFALAETYDPLVLRRLNAKGGIAADVGLAQTWYQKASELGSALAPERLERLAERRGP
jgi:hypothetical protein